jgi:hypothetical protein
VTISGGAANRPRVVMNADGQAVAAWSGATVQTATRPRGGGFGPPVTLAGDPGYLLDLAGDPDGDLSALWVGGEPAVETAWGAGGSFGPRVRFPFGGVPLLAPAPGGDAFYAWAENGRLMAVRRHEGTFGTAREVAAGLGLAAVAVDPAGALNVVGLASDGTVFVATGTPEGGFAPPLPISGAGNSAPVQAATSSRGDILVTWATPAAGLAATVRAAGASWSQAQDVPGAQGARQPDAALDDEGNALVAWTDGSRAWVGYRHADGRWEPAARVSGRPVCCTPGPPPTGELHPKVGFDGRGAAVIAWSDAEEARTLRAAVRPPEGPVRPFEVLANGAALTELDLAVDPQRNAVAVWTAGATRVQAAIFDPTTPVITAFAPGGQAKPTKPQSVIPPGFAYRVSEPAAVRVDVVAMDGGPARRLGTLRSLGSSRAGRLTVPKRLERRLARRGRYRATIAATTRGGRTARPRHISFRRVR